MKAMKRARGANVHFCSSAFKDGVQLRRRLVRRAMHISEAYQQVTEDGTLIRGFVRGEPDATVARLKDLGVPEDMLHPMDDRVEVAPWMLERIAPDLEQKAWLSEQYPTADGLEVERTPLNRGGADRKGLRGRRPKALTPHSGSGYRDACSRCPWPGGGSFQPCRWRVPSAWGPR